MLDVNDLREIGIAIKFPSEFKVESTNTLQKLSIDKINVRSFPNINISPRRLVDKLLEDLPYISLMGKGGIFSLDNEGIDVTISPKNDKTYFLDNDNKKKEFSRSDYERIGSDINYLVGSILGTLNLSDKALSTEVRFEFSKKDIFKKSFSNKIKREEFKGVALKDVQRISFSVEDKEEKTDNTEVIYHFERGDNDEVVVIKKSKKVFSPLDIMETIERFLGNLNGILKRW